MFAPFSACGIALARSVLTRPAVWVADGREFGAALKEAVVPAGSIWIAPTATTPDLQGTSFWSVTSRGSVVRGSEFEELELDVPAGWAGEPSLTAIRSGPLVRVRSTSS